MAQKDVKREIPGLAIDFLEWQVDLLPGVSIELVEIVPGAPDLSEIYVKPGTILELDDVELLESKIAL
jgi:hypothetical protein